MSHSDKLIDKRLIDRYVRKGLLDPAEYERILSKLPDCSDKIWQPAPELAPEPVTTEQTAPAEGNPNSANPRLEEATPDGDPQMNTPPST